jgi:hypothetical protein
MSNISINIDFDGTVVTHDFPRVGKDIGSQKVLKKLVEKGHQLILFTMRDDTPDSMDEYYQIKPGNRYLTDAINWFKSNDIPLYGIQSNPTQSMWTTSPKSYAELLIDDTALGCPLKYDLSISNRPFVDWIEVEKMLVQIGYL